MRVAYTIFCRAGEFKEIRKQFTTSKHFFRLKGKLLENGLEIWVNPGPHSMHRGMADSNLNLSWEMAFAYFLAWPIGMHEKVMDALLRKGYTTFRYYRAVPWHVNRKRAQWVATLDYPRNDGQPRFLIYNKDDNGRVGGLIIRASKEDSTVEAEELRDVDAQGIDEWYFMHKKLVAKEIILAYDIINGIKELRVDAFMVDRAEFFDTLEAMLQPITYKLKAYGDMVFEVPAEEGY